MSKFIGPYKVLGFEKVDHKTPSGGEIVRVQYEGRSPELMTTKSFELLATQNPGDLTENREKKYEVVIKELVATLMEYDIKAVDIPYVAKTMSDKMFDAFDRASNFLWTGDDSTWIPGDNAIHQRSLLEADIVLSRITINEPAAEATSTEDAPAAPAE